MESRDDFRLVVDVGNTAWKLAVFQGNRLVVLQRMAEGAEDAIVSILSQYAISRAMLCSVGQQVGSVDALLRSRVPTHRLSYQSRFPFRIAYESPEMLGGDRLAGLAGAYFSYPNESVLVVDAGTAITLDFLTAEGIYEGGTISPGVSLRFRALNSYTARLPLVEKEGEIPVLGSSTVDCIRSGVVGGVLGELERAIHNLTKQYGEIKVILAGGDADFLHGNLFYCNFVRSNLVLEGLNGLLEYNA